MKTINTEDELVKIYFFHVPSPMILSGQIDYREFPRHELLELMRSYEKEYSETESSLLYQIIRSESEWRADERESNGNVFFALVHVAEELLVIDHNDIRCHYSKLQRWRNISRFVGEDMLVCAFMARRLQNKGITTEWFGWNTVLKHNNKQLNAVISQGISENHFHLFGSAPIFHLIWIRLMNDVELGRYANDLWEMDRNIRNQHTYFDKSYKEDKAKCMVLQAALMRAVMYCYLNGKQEIFRGYDPGRSDIKLRRLMDALKMGEQIMEWQPEIRSKINLLKAEAMLARGDGLSDYAMENVKEIRDLNGVFAGERKLVYQMMCDILVYKRLPEEIQGLLYPYLAIRTSVRGTLIQNNDNLGFENFSIYNSQKRNLLTRKKETESMIEQAVLSSFKDTNLRSLEIRISPGADYLDNAKEIRKYERILVKKNHLDKERFCYIYHFAKKSDTVDRIGCGQQIPCRDSSLRREIRQKGNAILVMRRRMPEEASRVKGIDACAQEIGCRPEVFGPMFRQLRDQVISYGDHQVEQLRVTYHVGEDFLDMVDGLRAIDEVLHFLCMKNGDRLGHATVLGYNVEQWYERKHGRIVLPAQDYLDNVVWMYNMLLEFRIPGFDILKDYLLKEYAALFYQIYEEGVKVEKEDIFSYYEAWKLRGDLPELYRTGGYKPAVLEIPGQSPVTPDYPENGAVRRNHKVAGLYYAYHFNEKVRKAGKQPIERQVPAMYVEAVAMLQLEMQKKIVQMGIGIETNPSSNLMISSMESYEEHPIMSLYNLGLNHVDHSACAQLFVSINTDDKGVFHTSLENEYALMASTVENMVDDQGKRIHSPQEVYDWLDRIRRMGNQQAFNDSGFLPSGL